VRWLWQRLRARWVRFWIADDETSARMDQADRERRIREGRLP
jgi:hypothetical protein